MTLWILVEKDSIPDERAIYASCESFKKKALLRNSDGNVENVIIHGIASVFCDPKYRGHGYAKYMMQKLALVLEHWQIREGERCVGSILYSDIGKKYYSNLGWKPVPKNSHIEFPAQEHPMSEEITILQANDLEKLCSEDEIMIRKEMAGPSSGSQQRIIIIPDHDHMRWHHTKEEFGSRILFDKIPMQKGVLVGQPGNRIWAIWTHRFYHDPNPVPSGNVLYILRLVIENPGRDSEELQHQLKIIFQTAQAEAKVWNLDGVKLWDPSPCVQRLVRRMGLNHIIVEREEDGIACLLWYGDERERRPEWIANEKYAT